MIRFSGLAIEPNSIAGRYPSRSNRCRNTRPVFAVSFRMVGNGAPFGTHPRTLPEVIMRPTALASRCFCPGNANHPIRCNTEVQSQNIHSVYTARQFPEGCSEALFPD